MQERGVWHLVPPPNGKTIISNHWVFILKRDETGKIASFKACLIAQGFQQVKGESYNETFSPVVNFSVVRFFFSLLVSNLKWKNMQADIKSAYLYVPISEEIFMYQPQGHVDSNKQNWVCRLDRAVHVLPLKMGRVHF